MGVFWMNREVNFSVMDQMFHSRVAKIRIPSLASKMSFTSEEPHPWTVNAELQKLTLGDYIVERANYFGQDETAVLSIDGITGEKILFKDFDKLTSNLASWFHAHGLRKGDYVMFMSRNTTKQSTFLTGVWRANGVASASYQQDLAETILERVMKSSIKWIFCDAAEVAKCKAVAAQCPWEITLITHERVEGCVWLEDILQIDGNAPKLEVSPEDPALVLLTSGTTGKAKGALRTHKAALCVLLSSGAMGSYISPHLLATSPIHLSGAILPLSTLTIGVETIIIPNFDVLTIMENVQKYRVKSLLLLPATFNDLLTHPDRSKYDLSSLELLSTGGSLVLPKFYEKLQTLTKNVNLMYGSTECYGFISLFRIVGRGELEFAERKDYQVGKIMHGSSVQIRNKDSGKLLGPNEIGEIFAKHLGDIKEYLHDPEKTKAAFTSDGYYQLGDLGSIDENGILSVFGRDKDVFKYLSHHISPEDIEQVVMEHESVKECCVVGVVEKPDGDLIEYVPRAYVVLKDGKMTAGLSEEILNLCNSKLADYKQLRGGIYVVGALPRGSSGKISRLLVSQMQVNA